MSYTNGLDKPDLYFNTVLYSGNNTSQSLTVGFQPDLVWTKSRNTSGTQHNLIDSVRGVLKTLQSNNTNAEATLSGSLTSFDTDGYSIGGTGDFNYTGRTYVGWSWLGANGTASNTDGSITSTVSANTTSGFSIVSYTGNATSGATVGHGLGLTPKMFIVKRRNSTGGWVVYHEAIGNTKIIELHDTAASQVSSAAWNNTSPSSSTFTLGNYTSTNTSGGTYIAYCFAEKKGFSKVFSYTGNGSSDGSYIHLGMKPAWVLVKRTDSANAWHLFDNKRNTFNPNDRGLFPDTIDAENTGNQIDFLSNGIKFRSADGGYNGSGGSYIGLAFASNPFVTSTGIPTTAR